MPKLNLCQFIGNVGKIETRYMPDGKAVTNLSIAVNESWKNAAGEKQERTEWVKVSMFGRIAEVAGEYVKVGMPLYVSGRMQTRKWQDKDGNDRYTTEIVANEMQMLGAKGGEGDEGRAQQQAETAPPRDFNGEPF